MYKNCIIVPFTTADKYRGADPESLPENQFFIDLKCTSRSLSEFYSKR